MPDIFDTLVAEREQQGGDIFDQVAPMKPKQRSSYYEAAIKPWWGQVAVPMARGTITGIAPILRKAAFLPGAKVIQQLTGQPAPQMAEQAEQQLMQNVDRFLPAPTTTVGKLSEAVGQFIPFSQQVKPFSYGVNAGLKAMPWINRFAPAIVKSALTGAGYGGTKAFTEGKSPEEIRQEALNTAGQFALWHGGGKIGANIPFLSPRVGSALGGAAVGYATAAPGERIPGAVFGAGMNWLSPVERIARKPFIERNAEKLVKIENSKKGLREFVANQKQRGLNPTRDIAESDLLVGAVDNEGTVRTTRKGGAVEKYQDFLEPQESVVRKALEREGKKVSLEYVRAALTQTIGNTLGLEGEALENAYGKIDREMAGLKRRADKDGLIDLTKIQDAKVSKSRNVDYSNTGTQLADRAMAETFREMIENLATSENAKALNRELSRHYTNIDYLEKLDGTKVEGGRLGKWAWKVIGAKVGSYLGPAGTLAGAVGGGLVKGELMKRTFSGRTGKPLESSPEMQAALSRQAQPIPKAQGGTNPPTEPPPAQPAVLPTQPIAPAPEQSRVFSKPPQLVPEATQSERPFNSREEGQTYIRNLNKQFKSALFNEDLAKASDLRQQIKGAQLSLKTNYPAKAQPKSVFGHVISLGGLDPDLMSKDYSVKEWIEKGNLATLRKGGFAFDTIYDSLVSKGAIPPAPEGVTPGDWARQKIDESKRQKLGYTKQFEKSIEDEYNSFMEQEKKYGKGAIQSSTVTATESHLEKENNAQKAKDYFAEVDKTFDWPDETPLGPKAGGLIPEQRQGYEQTSAYISKKALTAQPTVGILGIEKATPVTDIFGQRRLLPKGEEYAVKPLGNKLYNLHDGQDVIVNENKLAGLRSQKENVHKIGSFGEETKSFAPELSQVEEVVKGQNRLPYLVEDAQGNEIGRFATRKEAQSISDKPGHRLIALGDELKTTIQDTKFSQYQLPGGENYREVLIKAPEFEDKPPSREASVEDKIKYLKSAPKEFLSSHWDEPNVFVHLRLNDRTTPDGKKVLFVEELQSDWARKVRELGAGKSEEWKSSIPSHPLLKNWQELALKRTVKEAVDKGYDYISWTTGEQQAERYDLSKQVKSIKWQPFSDGKAIELQPTDGSQIAIYTDKNGSIRKDMGGGGVRTEWQGKKLEDVIGKEHAKKVLEANSGNLSGQDLKIGGEWAKNLYDKQIPNILKDLTKGEIGSVDITGKRASDGVRMGRDLYQPALKITPEIRARVLGEQSKIEAKPQSTTAKAKAIIEKVRARGRR